MYPYPETALEALEQFKSGEVVGAVELGGLGPGYEQAIWNAVFSIIEALYDKTDEEFWTIKVDDLDNRTCEDYHKPVAKKRVWRDSSETKVAEAIKGQGLSGVQFGAARHTAYNLITQGWRAYMEKAPQGRFIMITCNPPHFKTETKGEK